MTAIRPRVAVAVVVLSILALPVAAAQAGSPTAGDGGANATALSPGQRLGAVVAVQDAEVDGEIAQRRLAARLAAAEGENATAAAIAAELSTARERLDDVRATRERLRTAWRNGSITRAEFTARMVGLAAAGRSVGEVANRSEEAAAGVSPRALAARGVDADAIERLRTDASNLTGPEVAAVARSVAASDAGAGLAAPGRPTDPGPPARAGPPDGDRDTGTANATGTTGSANERGPPADRPGGGTASGPPEEDPEPSGNTTVDAGQDRRPPAETTSESSPGAERSSEPGPGDAANRTTSRAGTSGEPGGGTGGEGLDGTAGGESRGDPGSGSDGTGDGQGDGARA